MAASGVWPDCRAMDLLGIESPILQAPMAGAQGSDLAIAVSEAGGLGALPCAKREAVAPAMTAGVTDQSWSIEEMIETVLRG